MRGWIEGGRGCRDYFQGVFIMHIKQDVSIWGNLSTVPLSLFEADGTAEEDDDE